HAHGGGHVRGALSVYLARDLIPKLRAGCRPALRRRLLTSATELTYLCAFMCFDDEAHPEAQRYYLTALQMATENSDPASYAITLRGMSVQAHALGHHSQALQLAELGVAIAHHALPATRRAFLQGQLAVAQAAHADRTEALTTLAAAERRIEQTSSATSSPVSLRAPVMGAYHRAAFAYQQANVRSLLGDTTGAITALKTSTQHRPADERRSRAIVLAHLAELQLASGLRDQAIITWHRFLDDLPLLVCGRATTALKTMRALLRPHARNPAAAALLHRAATFDLRHRAR
ncbi:hypothetical protein ACFQ08_06770, partial [Streptosporangium algeriense]